MFVGPAAAVDQVPRALLAVGVALFAPASVSGQMFATIQAVYSEAHTAGRIDQCIEDSAITSWGKAGMHSKPIPF